MRERERERETERERERRKEREREREIEREREHIWKQYQAGNSVPTSHLANDLATAPLRLVSMVYDSIIHFMFYLYIWITGST